MQIKVNNRELKEVYHFKYLGSVLTRDGYCTREIKMRIAIVKEAFKRKMSLLTSKLNIELKKKLVRCYVLEHCFIWRRDLDTKKIGAELFGELWNLVLEKIKYSEKVTNEQILCRLGENRTILNNILRRKTNSIGHILRKIASFMIPLNDRWLNWKE